MLNSITGSTMLESVAKPVIFVAFANDHNDDVNYLRNLPEEARQIREPIQRACRDELCEYVERANATAEDIFRVFQDPEYRDRIAVFHYGGHANGYQLLLESSDGQPAAADAGGFADFLGQQNGLQLVFLNGCSTQNQVTGLLDASVPSVIATSRAIDDEVAMNFARQFYQGLSGGASIRTSYNEAVAGVQTTKGGNSRALYLLNAEGEQISDVDVDRLPWDLYLKEGAETVNDWNLPLAAGDPLFGLPPLPELDLPAVPFRHLSWFEAEHAEVFFGRGHQIRDLYETVTRPKSSPIVLLYGQSGVGKSSILAAGLIPRLHSEYEVCYVRRDQELGLLASVKQTLTKKVVELRAEASIHFADDWTDVEQRSSKPLVLIVDQLEECFTQPNPNLPQELDEFFNEIQAILGKSDERPQGRLILGFRKEWLAEIETRLQVRRLPQAKVFLERMGRRGIIEAVLGPANSKRLQQQYGLTIEPKVAALIADDLLEDHGSAIAPTLQVLLTKMWFQATGRNQSSPRFDQDVYWKLKREGILLQDFLDQQFDKISQWQPDIVESGLLLDLLTLHTTTLGTAAHREEAELPLVYPHRVDVLAPLLQKCKDLYLLVDPSEDRRTEEKGTRLSHDTLAPLVRARFEVSDKPGQRARRILDNRSPDWDDEQNGATLDIMDLKLVEQGQPGLRALNETEQRLFAASCAERAKRIRAQNWIKIIGGVALVIIAGLSMYTLKMSADRAADRYTIAREAVDAYYNTVAGDVLLNQPGMTDLRKELYTQGQGFYAKFIEDFGGKRRLQDAVAVANFNLGLVEMEQGGSAKAMEYFTAAGAIQEGLYEPGSLKQSESKWQVAYDHSKTLTQIGKAEQDPARKKIAYDQAFDIRTELDELVVSQDAFWLDYKLRLADANMHIALLAESRIDFSENEEIVGEIINEAKQKYEEARIILKEKILGSEMKLEKDDELKTRRALGMLFQNIRGLYVKMYGNAVSRKLDTGGYLKEIIGNSEDAIEQLTYVLDEKGDSEAAFSRASCYFTIAYYTGVRESFEQAIQELNTVVWANPNRPEYRQELARINYEWGRVKKEKEYFIEAKNQLELILDKWPEYIAAQDLLAKCRDKIESLAN